MASNGGEGSNGANGGGYVITIRREDFGEITNEESIHMRDVIKESVTEALASGSEHNPFNKLAKDVKRLETNERQMEIRSEEKELESRLLNSLKEIIITLATFFIYFISFLGSFQQASHDHSLIIVVAVLVVVICFFTGFLVYIWWSELNSIKDETRVLKQRKQEQFEGCERKWHVCRGLVITLGIVVVGFSVYFASILYSQWLSGSNPAPSPSPSALQLPSNVPLDTQYYAVQ